MSKIIVFENDGYTFGVREEQVEKILINKHPEKSEFVLSTGVEVKDLSKFLPFSTELSDFEEFNHENIIFIKGQKDFYGFTVDNIKGYLNVKEDLGRVKKNSAVECFVRYEEKLIPVLDLKGITNNEVTLTEDEVREIESFSDRAIKGKEIAEDEEDIFEVSQEEVYNAIEEEIKKQKREIGDIVVIQSEKKGFVLPLVVNIVIVVMVTAGILYYTMIGNKEAFTVMRAGKVGGVEEAVIKEIRRRSEQEVEAQKKKLEEAKKKLAQLEKEREYFLKNQQKILAEKERKLREEFERKLKEARERIIASGVKDVEGAYQKEKERLYAEFLKEREKTQKEIEEARKKFEEQLKKKEEILKSEVARYNKQIQAMEQQLMEQREKLKAAEKAVQSIRAKQEEYLAFRKQLNILYGRALNYFAAKKYNDGISVLKNMLPVITTAKKRGIGDSYELSIEEKLVSSLINLAEGANSRVEYNKLIKETYEAAVSLENNGRYEEALMKYFTVYTLSNDKRLKNDALIRARSLMTNLYNKWDENKKEKVRERVKQIIDEARDYKKMGNYNEALNLLQQAIGMFAGMDLTKEALDEIIDINNKIRASEEEKRIAEINSVAGEIFKRASKSYEQGFVSDAYEGFKEIILHYRESKYTDMAVKMMDRINSELKSMKVTGKVNLIGKSENSGVVIQILSKSILLVSLGSEDGLSEGDTLQIVRKSGKDVVFVGNVKLIDVFPTTSKGRLLLYENQPEVGDLVIY